MKQRISSEFLYQLFALLITIILVHAIYVGVVRPNADAILERQAELLNSGAEYVPKRSFYVVIRDFEQEACFVLLIWALAIMGYKGRRIMEEQNLLEQRLIDVPEGTSLLPEDAREYSRPLEALDEYTQDFLLPRTLLSALQRFATTAFPPCPTPSRTNVIANPTGWTRSSRWFDTLPGPYPRSGLSAPYAVSAMPWGRPMRRLQAISVGSPKVWAWRSTVPLLRWC